jgi:hypothetical protein
MTVVIRAFKFGPADLAAYLLFKVCAPPYRVSALKNGSHHVQSQKQSQELFFRSMTADQ